MDVVSLRFSCDVGWQRSGREGWPSCMIKSRRGGSERPKGGRESDFPFACTHSGRSLVFFLVRRVVSCCVHVSIHSRRRQCVSFLPSLSGPPRPSMLCSRCGSSFHHHHAVFMFRIQIWSQDTCTCVDVIIGTIGTDPCEEGGREEGGGHGAWGGTVQTLVYLTHQ